MEFVSRCKDLFSDMLEVNWYIHSAFVLWPFFLLPFKENESKSNLKRTTADHTKGKSSSYKIQASSQEYKNTAAVSCSKTLQEGFISKTLLKPVEPKHCSGFFKVNKQRTN